MPRGPKPATINPPQQARSRRTLERIVEASLEILAVEGPDALTVNRVVDKAGSSVGSFYARFEGKDDLLDYPGERVWTEALDRWNTALESRDWSEHGLAEAVEGTVQLIIDSQRSRSVERTPTGGHHRLRSRRPSSRRWRSNVGPCRSTSTRRRRTVKGTAPSRRDRIRSQLADLKMPGSLESLDEVLSRVDGAKLGAAGSDRGAARVPQISLRNNRRLQAAMRSSRLPAVKTLADFDFTFSASDQARAARALHELGFLERKENVIFLGPQVSARRTSRSARIAAAQNGRRVYYGTLTDLITSLEEAQAAGKLPHRLKTLTYPPLLVVDELGYLPMTPNGALLFYQLWPDATRPSPPF